MVVLSAAHSTCSSGRAIVGFGWGIVIACTRVIIVLISMVVSVVNRMILIAIGRIVNSRLTLNSMFLLVMMTEVMAR